MSEEIKTHIEKLKLLEYNLINSICDLTKIKIEDFLGQRRCKRFVNARKMATYILCKRGYSLKHIGEIISIIPKDHTTIIYQNRQAKNHYEKEPEFKNIVDSLVFINKTNFTSLKYIKRAS